MRRNRFTTQAAISLVITALVLVGIVWVQVNSGPGSRELAFQGLAAGTQDDAQDDGDQGDGAGQDDNASSDGGSGDQAEASDGNGENTAADADSFFKAVDDGTPVRLIERSEFQEAEETWINDVDDFFGTWLVNPLGSVLFFDFWTSRFIRTDGYWTASDDGATVAISSDRDGVFIRHQFVDEIDGKKEDVVQKFFAPDVDTLKAKLPDGAALFDKYATKDNRGSTSIPFVVVWLLFGAVFFTVRMKFINVRAFGHAIRLVKGDYDKPGETGEVSHFQALASALSATVGLGNIAGVAIAIGTGGPGATFWMIVIGLFGMSMKFTECSLGQMYRKVLPDGTVSGGPMRYLKDGLAEMKLAPLGVVLAGLFMVLCILASFGGGNAFQVGQSLGAVRTAIPLLDDYPWIYGLVMAVMVGLVIIGGIKSIGAVAGKIVPFMCAAYVAAALVILGKNAGQIPDAFGAIFAGAFSAKAIYGGFLGVLVTGIRRAVFSNEAGAGSAAIAHSAAKTDEPISEGIVALMEPFIDTVVVCTMTALVIVITGVYNPVGPNADLISGDQGAALTSVAFSQGGYDWFRWILYLAVVLFAFSTLISWSYYGERCFTTLFGERSSMTYKVIYLVFTFLGSIVTATNVKNFSDLLILGMAFPNILGVLILSGKVRLRLDDYWGRLKSGEMKPQK